MTTRTACRATEANVSSPSGAAPARVFSRPRLAPAPDRQIGSEQYADSEPRAPRPGAGHDFRRVSVYGQRAGAGAGGNAALAGSGWQRRVRGPSQIGFPGTIADSAAARKKKVNQSMSGSSAPSGGATARAISASGSGTVTTTYTPEAKDKSTKIVFIQVMRELLDGNPVKPSVAAPAFAYQDAVTTGDFYHVDYVSGEKDPYYNGDDPQDFGTQGNALAKPAVAASTHDTPNYNDGSFPAGKSKLLWEFRTAAFSAAGEDAGTYYGYVDWAYAKEKGKAANTAIGTSSATEPGRKFEDAVKLWSSKNGFKLPGKGSALTGALIGAGIGAGIGIAVGALVGGPIGALIGGLLGGAAGAGIGALAGRKGS